MRQPGYYHPRTRLRVSLSSAWNQLPASFMRSISIEPTVFAPSV